MQVVILAGGLGTRLGGLTRDLPKPLVPVAGRPFLERQIEFLAGQGFSEFLLLTGHLADRIERRLEDGSRLGVEISYSREPRPLGTGGGLRRALPRLREGFLLLYGDSFLPVDYRTLAAGLDVIEVVGVMAVLRDDAGATGVAPNVATDGAGRVVRYAKGERGDDLRYVEAGALALRAGAVARLPEGVSSLEADLYPALVAEGRMAAWVTPTPFYDIGTPEGLRRAEAFFAAEAAGRET
jgi:NDP-sugar pyrophosphorylase family protein